MPPQAILQDMVADHIRSTPGEWQEIQISISAVSGIMTGQAQTNDQEWVDLTGRTLNSLKTLRDLMADPVRGAWLTLTATIPRAGEPTFTYDWMSKPDWGFDEDINPQSYLDDLRKYPRAPEYIPDWYPKQPTSN